MTNIQNHLGVYVAIISIIVGIIAIVVPLKLCNPSLPQLIPEWITIELSVYDNLPSEGIYSLEYYTVNEETSLHIRNLVLIGLEPKNDYKLTLNGIPGKLGNEELMIYKKTDGEGYYDFLTIKTDENGNYYGDNFTARNLPSARYNIKFFIKDAHDEVVLKYDWLDFEIK